MKRKRSTHSYDSLTETNFDPSHNYRRKTAIGKEAYMTGQVWKVQCHVCSYSYTAGTKSEAHFFARKHEHIDTECKRVA